MFTTERIKYLKRLAALAIATAILPSARRLLFVFNDGQPSFLEPMLQHFDRLSYIACVFTLSFMGVLIAAFGVQELCRRGWERWNMRRALPREEPVVDVAVADNVMPVQVADLREGHRLGAAQETFFDAEGRTRLDTVIGKESRPLSATNNSHDQTQASRNN